jgi:hypothetical protein
MSKIEVIDTDTVDDGLSFKDITASPGWYQERAYNLPMRAGVKQHVTNSHLYYYVNTKNTIFVFNTKANGECFVKLLNFHNLNNMKFDPVKNKKIIIHV